MKYNLKEDLKLKKRAVDVFLKELGFALKKRMEKGTKSHANNWRFTNLEKEATEEIWDFLNYFFVLKKLQWREDKKRPKKVCFDFDGVIVKKYRKYIPHKFTAVNKSMADFIRRLYRKYQIIVFTARQDEELPEIAAYLKKHKIPFDRVTNQKLSAICYVDDRAVRYTPKTNLKEIEKLIDDEAKNWLQEIRSSYKII